MTPVFGRVYADLYDGFYKDKDYEAECDQIEKIFQHFANGTPQHILDLGCGTGNHAIPLTRRGYRVTGIDRSLEMLEHARNKIAGSTAQENLHLVHGDIRDYQLDESFDAILCMFAVLGYQLSNQDILATLKCARQHLQPGGLLIFDVWYGPAVLTVRPSERVKVIPTRNGQMIRWTSAALETRQHLCQVNFHVWNLEGNRLVDETEETHWMRYFFPLEIELFLNSSQFRLLHLGSFPDFDQEVCDDTWNVTVIAKAA